jgi:transketolase C-terminal domain/subunit
LRGVDRLTANLCRFTDPCKLVCTGTGRTTAPPTHPHHYR